MRDLNFRTGWGARPIDVAELGNSPPRAGTVSLRRFPFPFRAGLAICDDSRGADPATFAAVRSAFSERKLEIGACTSFDTADPCSVDGPLAAQLQAAGLLDGVVGLPRGGAAAAASRLAQAGLTPQVFAGGAPIEQAAALATAGVRYFTDDGVSGTTKFGEGLSFRNSGELRSYFAAFQFDQFGFPGAEDGTDLDSVFAALAPESARAFLRDLFDAPLFEVPGLGPLTVFKRYSGPQRPAAPMLPLQLRSQFLAQIELWGGAVVVQQRLGDDALIGLAPGQEARVPADASVLGLHELLALDDLAERAGDRILVASTARLLGWLDLRRRATITAPAAGSIGVAWAGDPEGLALTIPHDAPTPQVRLNDDALPLAMAREPDPASPGMDCLYLPWRARLWPSS